MEGHLRPCEVKGRKAYFHGIFQHSTTVGPSAMIGGPPGGTIAYSLAVIEYPDGTVAECNPQLIKFTDREESTNG